MVYEALDAWGRLRVVSPPFSNKDSGSVPRLCYGGMVPSSVEIAHGGRVKLMELNRAFPDSPDRFNILYLVSSAHPMQAYGLIRRCQDAGIKVILNQNGVAYPGWYGSGWQLANRRLRRLLSVADHVVYQSTFCKLAADQFLVERRENWDIVYNSVDTESFAPAQKPNTGKNGLVLLLGGNQYQYYRFEAALVALAEILKIRANTRLLVTGRLNWIPDEERCRNLAEQLIQKLGITGHVEFTGPYLQQDAPALFQRADILIHTKYNDPCPTVILEAMACGLPVVYSGSGGVPELVGPDAGIAIAAPLSWDKDVYPEPEQLRDGVLTLAEDLPRFSRAARKRAVDRFDSRVWLEEHQRIFSAVLNGGGP